MFTFKIFSASYPLQILTTAKCTSHDVHYTKQYLPLLVTIVSLSPELRVAWVDTMS
jgi:hypothetical protein